MERILDGNVNAISFALKVIKLFNEAMVELFGNYPNVFNVLLNKTFNCFKWNLLSKTRRTWLYTCIFLYYLGIAITSRKIYVATLINFGHRTGTNVELSQ